MVIAGIPTIVAEVVFAHLFSFSGVTIALPSAAVAEAGDVGVAFGGPGAAVSAPPSPPSSSAVLLAAPARPSGAARRRDIARTRSLRAKIQTFEEAFAAAHDGRKPHGAERGPLLDVYVEYRAMKQRIRDSAAVHIQAVWRGHAARGIAARARASRAAAGAPSSADPPPPSSSSSATPVRPSGGGSAPASGGGGGAPSAQRATARDKVAALRAEKSELKARLRAFDAQFAAATGRAPSKADKEHLRPSYQRYHELKVMIATIEAAIAGAAAATTAAESATAAAAAAATTARRGGDSGGASSGGGGGFVIVGTPQRAAPAPAPPAAIPGVVAVPAAGPAAAGVPPASTAAAPAVVAALPGPASASNRSSSGVAPVSLAAAPSLAASAAASSDGAGAAGSASPPRVDGDSGAGAAPLSAAVSDAAMRELRAEKRRLQGFLRDYERAFEAREGRRVQFVRDISSVLDHYQRYKMLKGILQG